MHGRGDKKRYKEDDGQPGKETANMAPMYIDSWRYRTNFIEKLHKEPIEQVYPSRDIDIVAENLKKNDLGFDSRAGEQEQERANDAGNRAAGPYHVEWFNTLAAVEEKMSQVTAETDDEVEGQEFQMPQVFLDAGAKNIKDDDIRCEMYKTHVQEYASRSIYKSL